MKKRLFIAIELPDKLKTELGYVVDQLATVGGLKSVKKDQLHITLAFLGDTDTARITSLKKIMDKVSRLTHPPKITPKLLSPFLNLADFRGVWVPVEMTPELSNLANILRAELINSGMHPDPKPFNAHITLARHRSQRDLAGGGGAKSHVDLDELQSLLKELSSPPLPPGLANIITLFSSQLTPQGHVYTNEHESKLEERE